MPKNKTNDPGHSQGGKRAPQPDFDDTPTDWQTYRDARTGAGWHMKLGNAVVYNENYEVGTFTYYADQSLDNGHVWRIPTKQLG